METVGHASAIMGLVALPIFMTSAIIGLKSYANSMRTNYGHSAVRIYTGFGDGNAGNWDGNTPGITLFNSVGQVIAYQVGEKEIVPSNAYRDLSVPHFYDQKRATAEYVSISQGGDDAICIAQIDVKNDDGTQIYFSGDVIATCFREQIPVFPSSHYIGDDHRQPWCFWLDRNKSKLKGNGAEILTQGITFHIPSFWPSEERCKQYTDEQRSMCAIAARLNIHKHWNVDNEIDIFKPPIRFHPQNGTDMVDWATLIKHPVQKSETAFKFGPGRDPHHTWPEGVWGRRSPEYGTEEDVDAVSDEKRRQARIQREERWVNQVARQRNNQNSARSVCATPNSYGPNFLSEWDGWFCDLQSHTLYPVCERDDQDKRACYDVEVGEIRELEEVDDGQNMTLTKRVAHRTFTDIVDWGVAPKA